MTETTSNSGGKGSKTTKRSRNSPPEAPTPKPLQKLSKTNKLDNLILNFLKTPTKTRVASRAGGAAQEEDQANHYTKEAYPLKVRRKRL